MKHGPSSLALRKTREHFSARPVIPIMIGVTLVIGLSGPFGTFERLSLLFRLAYWGCVVVLTYGTAIFVISIASQVLPKTWPRVLIDGVSGMIAGPSVTLIVLILNSMAFPQSQATGGLPSVLLLFVNCTAISMVISILVGQMQTSTPLDDAAPHNPALLDRLPIEKRGALISLQAQDHYVRVTTTRGSQLLLIRIGDAIAETAPTVGFQTHRSHWAAKDHITKSKQQGERGTLTMTEGSDVPVSRKYMPTLKAAGFFV